MASRKKRDLSYIATTDGELEALAAVTPSKVANARAAWLEVAPVEFRGLPNAVAITGTDG